jgi:hypothetical protein
MRDYLPNWSDGRHTSGSLLYQVLTSCTEGEGRLVSEIERGMLGRFLSTADYGEPYRVWAIDGDLSPHEEAKVTLTVSATDIVVRRATSLFDFDTASDAVWWSDPGHHQLLLRNLAHRETTAVGAAGVYTISGETSWVTSDEDLFWRIQGNNFWTRIAAEKLPTSGDTVTLPHSGTVELRYSSATRLAALSGATVLVERNGKSSGSLPLQEAFLPNLLDGYGALLGIPRLEGEKGDHYRARLLREMLAPASPVVDGVVRGISSRFGWLYGVEWDGRTTVTFSGATSLTVIDAERLLVVEEELSPAGDGLNFYASLSGWRDGSLVTVDGIPQFAYSRTDNKVTFTSAISGRVAAEYSVEQYVLTQDSSGKITALTAGTGLPSGSYTILWTDDVQAWTVDEQDFLQTRLLTADGKPNRLYVELAQALTEGNPTTFGRARWGRASWFYRQDNKPGTTHLPVPFDEV